MAARLEPVPVVAPRLEAVDLDVHAVGQLGAGAGGAAQGDLPQVRVMPEAGIEPARVASPDFESGASASSATPAGGVEYSRRAVNGLLRHPLAGQVLGAWLVSRAVLLAGAFTGSMLVEAGLLRHHPRYFGGVVDLLTWWDGRYYLLIGQHGYPGGDPSTLHGFFPVVPATFAVFGNHLLAGADRWRTWPGWRRSRR